MRHKKEAYAECKPLSLSKKSSIRLAFFDRNGIIKKDQL